MAYKSGSRYLKTDYPDRDTEPATLEPEEDDFIDDEEGLNNGW